MAGFGEYDEFSEVNAVGNPNKVIHLDEAGKGAGGFGPVGNTRPATIVSEGLSIETFPRLYCYPQIRKGQSVTKNESLHRSLSSRK